MVVPLNVSDELARIKLVSEPPGAQVYQNGQLLAGVQTPAEVLVEAGKVQRFMLSLRGHVPAFIDPFTAGRGAAGVVKTGKLVPGVVVKIEATQEGKITVNGAPHCREVGAPAECVLAPGQYAIDFMAPPAKFTHQVTVANKSLTEKFELGFVEAPDGKHLEIGGRKVKKVLMEAGTRTVTVVEEGGNKNVQVRVKAGATVTAK
jgi:hypothetical protein